MQVVGYLAAGALVAAPVTVLAYFLWLGAFYGYDQETDDRWGVFIFVHWFTSLFPFVLFGALLATVMLYTAS